ncbi:Bug family tripartite tricarboxylate transporter substrate binding protein [Actibacterium pelagium]|uniref:Tripartite-type tricarboxylate transporter, receptor component TctC n=1 Tax=Actibacterium pelagium TaxID=2029103 RepID=A0A917AL07_9RHOB|nr:hypothetical protein [Actibacterium pelagium]GGE59077.1 hypothetical protein GCM10011517_28490 [Actibacterium pelagium]
MKTILRTLAALAFGVPAMAFEADQLILKVGYSAGGGYDQSARLVADHLGRFLPGSPDVVVQNVPGAGSLKLARLFIATGQNDGSELAMIGSALGLTPVFSPDEKSFDPQAVHYLASLSNQSAFCVTSKESGITSFEQLLSSSAKLGATGKKSTTYTYGAAIKAATGSSIKIITGFEGGSEINLAMERGEIDVRCGYSFASLMRAGGQERFNILVELGAERQNLIEGTDYILDYIEEPSKREALVLVFSSNFVHYPLIAHPDTPEPTIKVLRDALKKMSTDDAFLADVAKRGQPIVFTPGEDVEVFLDTLLNGSPEVHRLARELVK